VAERHTRCASGRAGRAAALALVALASCWTPGGQISPLMVKLGKDARTPVPLLGQAVVEFLRPNEDNSMTQSTVYDMRSDGDHFVGVVSGSVEMLGQGPDCVRWAHENVDSIVQKRNQYLPRYYQDSEWIRKDNGLHAEDGYP